MDHIVSPPSRSALERYLAGEASPDEAALVRHWIAADPTRSASASALKTLDAQLGVSGLGRASVTRALSTRWDEVRSLVIKPAVQPFQPGARSIYRAPTMSWMRRVIIGVASVAAAAGIVTMSGLWSRVVRATAVTESYATARAERRTVTLPDGSELMLAPDTRVTYHAAKAGDRTITLSGQARFTVTHDPTRPFVVRTGTVTTRVLGTRFDVRAYPVDPNVQVAVMDGRVSSGGARGSVVVSAGMIARVTDSLAAIVTADDATTPLEWADGKLVFRNTSVRMMLSTLERWYGLEFRVPDSALAARRVSAVLLANQPTQSLNELKDMLDVTLTYDDTVVTVRRRTRATQNGGAPVRRIDPTPFQAEVGK